MCPFRSYIEKHFGGAENFSTQDLQQAMTHMRENLDGSDKGQTISESEVEDHLRSLMQVRAPVSCRQLTIVACRLRGDTVPCLILRSAA